jgi:hypothetical protein
MLIFTKNLIEQLCNRMSSYSTCVTYQDPFGYNYKFECRDKCVVFTWPQTNREEIWIALLQNGKCLLQMAEEPATIEGQNEIISFYTEVSRRFFEEKTRRRRKWKYFGSWRFEFLDNGIWSDIYMPLQKSA